MWLAELWGSLRAGVAWVSHEKLSLSVCVCHRSCVWMVGVDSTYVVSKLASTQKYFDSEGVGDEAGEMFWMELWKRVHRDRTSLHESFDVKRVQVIWKWQQTYSSGKCSCHVVWFGSILNSLNCAFPELVLVIVCKRSICLNTRNVVIPTCWTKGSYITIAVTSKVHNEKKYLMRTLLFILKSKTELSINKTEDIL